MVNEIEFSPPKPVNQYDLLFYRMRGSEALGAIPEYYIDLLSSVEDCKRIKPADVLGKKASVKMLTSLDPDTGVEKIRHFHGLITEFEYGGIADGYRRYRVELRPWLWQLTLGADSRVFQDKTAVEIIDAVFAEYSTKGEVKKHLKATYRSRPYTVQYRESDYNFVTRLMEEEGICFHFTHDEDDATLELYDNAEGFAVMTDSKLQWHEHPQKKPVPNLMLQWFYGHRLGSLKYTHTDFAADTPTADLKTEATRTLSYAKPNDLEVFDYPGGYEDLAMPESAATSAKTTEGKRLAKLQVNRWESRHATAVGVSTFRYVAAGVTFKLTEHSDAGEYLITRTDFDCEFGGYEGMSDETTNSFTARLEAVPKDTDYLPLPRATRALVHGPQTATVVGASGDEILTDKYGRVKVQFHWDRVGKKNEKSSCWVRVSQPWASKQFGMIALPRVGDEVVVDFLEGNPDRPLITGRVYNGDNLPPYKLPAQATVSGIKTQSSKGGGLANANELRFEDKMGSEYVWFQAEKDYHQMVKNDAFYTVKGNATTAVTKDVNLAFGANLNLGITSKSSIKADGDVHAKLGADLLMAITGALGVAVTGEVALKGSQAIALTATTDINLNAGTGAKLTAATQLQLKGLEIVLSADTQISLKAGPSFITIGPSGVSISGPMVMINSGGSGGTAAAAAKAAPASPAAPAEPPENKDPLASADGGSS